MNYIPFIIGGAVFVVIYLIIRFLNRPNLDFYIEYNKILKSDEYKVKGQFEDN